MNRKYVFNVAGRVLEAMAIIMLLPMIVSLIYYEMKSAMCFLGTAAVSFVIGFVTRRFTKTKNHVIYAKEGFLIVALTWLVASLAGCFPFYISREIPSFIDAFFETVSGFTTTGASLLTNVQELSKGMLFWRSFTHWIGGMGVLVFIIAFVSNISDRSIHILRAEMPGPTVGKLTPRAKDTSKALYMIYILMTLVEVIMLLCGGMPLFDSLVHAFGTAGTGGFSINPDSIMSYPSPYIQWVITAFMILFGINFNLYYLLILRSFKSALKSTEMWVYFGILAVSVAVISINLTSNSVYDTVSDTVRHASFQVSSIVSTTGYATADFDLWPSLSKAVLFILMMMGACAGSTSGGLKLTRVILLFKLIAAELRRMIHPRSVTAIKFEGKEVEENTQRSVATYFAVYAICIVLTFFVISLFDSFTIETNFTATVSCFNNVGPGFAGVGPMSSYAAYSPVSKIVLSLAMLLGRLEIFPILIAMIPSTWRRKS